MPHIMEPNFAVCTRQWPLLDQYQSGLWQIYTHVVPLQPWLELPGFDDEVVWLKAMANDILFRSEERDTKSEVLKLVFRGLYCIRYYPTTGASFQLSSLTNGTAYVKAQTTHSTKHLGALNACSDVAVYSVAKAISASVCLSAAGMDAIFIAK